MPEHESPAHAALRAAGYSDRGAGWQGPSGPGARLWKRRDEGTDLSVWGYRGGEVFEVGAYEPSGVGGRRIELFPLSPADLAARLPELERRALAAMRALRGEGCGWTDTYGEGVYDTGCGHAFVLNSDTPEENEMRFCCYCGRALHTEATP